MDIFARVISCLSIAGTIFVYVFHDHKLKVQQRLLNDLSLKKAQKEEEDTMTAKIFLELKKDGSDSELVIANIGQAIAYDVKLSSEEEKDPVKELGFSLEWPIIAPGQKIHRSVAQTMGLASSVEYEISWCDKIGKHCEHQTIDYYY